METPQEGRSRTQAQEQEREREDARQVSQVAGGEGARNEIWRLCLGYLLYGVQDMERIGYDIPLTQ